MENIEYTFKTNINCGNCIKAITPHFEKTAGIAKWNVNTEDERKILTVISNGISREKIIEVVTHAGFNIEPLQ